MKPFWIINTKHFMHLVMAMNKDAATEKFNDSNAVKSDYTFPAEVCSCGCNRYLQPNVPKWMEYTLATEIKLCGKTKNRYIENEHKEPELHAVVVGQDLDKYFRHYQRL
jgi:hypothetical protein